jgi:4-hydroxy-3-polyprenylbenzoate decarboxylase
MKILVAISGASGVSLGIKAYELLPNDIEKHLVLSDSARTVLKLEEGFSNANIAAPSASGSFGIEAMLLAPCSMNTLAKIACGIADNLITRSAYVMIKEKRRLLIAPREIPFDPIALDNMLKLSRIGVIIAPPIVGYYADHNTVDEMERFIIGRWFDLLDIRNDLFLRWNGGKNHGHLTDK